MKKAVVISGKSGDVAIGRHVPTELYILNESGDVGPFGSHQMLVLDYEQAIRVGQMMIDMATTIKEEEGAP